MKKIWYFILGLFSALLSTLLTLWAVFTFQKPTTVISGKVKAKKGGIANLSITNKEKREARKNQRKLKKLLK